MKHDMFVKVSKSALGNFLTTPSTHKCANHMYIIKILLYNYFTLDNDNGKCYTAQKENLYVHSIIIGSI